MIIASNLPPKEIWPEAINTSTLLSDILPRHCNNWRSPHEAWHTYANWKLKQRVYVTKPDLSFLKVYGCKAFILNDLGKAIAQGKPPTQKAREEAGSVKFGPRAHVGYLVGYGPTLWQRHSTNTFRI